MEMALTADPITAEEGHQYGLIARLTEQGEAVEVAMGLAERIARNAPLAVAASKQLIKATQGATDDEFYAMQEPLVLSVFTSKDAAEGPKAFAEKRAPDWSGT
jgi:enoyl-CoA hydratase